MVTKAATKIAPQYRKGKKRKVEERGGEVRIEKKSGMAAAKNAQRAAFSRQRRQHPTPPHITLLFSLTNTLFQIKTSAYQYRLFRRKRQPLLYGLQVLINQKVGCSIIA